MPELPEIEVVRRGLTPHLENRSIENIWYSGKKLRHPFDINLSKKQLVGQKITKITRRGRYLIVHLTSHFLVVHLGMSGTLGIFDKNSPKARHTHIIFLLDNQMEMRFIDPRRFGSVQVFSAPSSAALEQTVFCRLGPEPFSRACSPEYLHRMAVNKSGAIKNFIMDNHILVGVGNIYANESLFRAQINPQRSAKSLTLKEWQTLHKTIVETLNWAIKCGGSTISDFINASGEGGYFQANFRVYGRADSPCLECGQPIKKVKIGGRSSFYCSSCQK